MPRGGKGMNNKTRQRGLARFRGVGWASVLARRVPVATTWRARLLGLSWLDAERAGAGLLIPRCRSVHTFGMRFDLCIVFLDADGFVLEEHARVGANRVVSCRGATAVLEVPA